MSNKHTNPLQCSKQKSDKTINHNHLATIFTSSLSQLPDRRSCDGCGFGDSSITDATAAVFFIPSDRTLSET